MAPICRRTKAAQKKACSMLSERKQNRRGKQGKAGDSWQKKQQREQRKERGEEGIVKRKRQAGNEKVFDSKVSSLLARRAVLSSSTEACSVGKCACYVACGQQTSRCHLTRQTGSGCPLSQKVKATRNAFKVAPMPSPPPPLLPPLLLLLARQ